MGRETEQTFSQSRHTDGQQAHEKMFNSTNYQKNANHNHNCLTSATMPFIRKARNNKCRQGYGEKRTLMHCWQECKLVQPPIETSMEIPQKIKNRNTIQSSNSTSGYLSKEYKHTNSKRYMHPYFHCSIIYNSQDMETTYVSIHGWIHKKRCGRYIRQNTIRSQNLKKKKG